MNKIILLEELKAFTEAVTSEIIMPVKPQKGDTDPGGRRARIYLARLPDMNSSTKKAPYIIHQVITSKDEWKPGKEPESSALIRSIFCVYNEDGQEGGLMLLNLMEALRIPLLKQAIIGKQFELDLDVGVETLVYPDDTDKFYLGEMITTWKLPAIKREVSFSYGYIRK